MSKPAGEEALAGAGVACKAPKAAPVHFRFGSFASISAALPNRLLPLRPRSGHLAKPSHISGRCRHISVAMLVIVKARRRCCEACEEQRTDFSVFFSAASRPLANESRRPGWSPGWGVRAPAPATSDRASTGCVCVRNAWGANAGLRSQRTRGRRRRLRLPFGFAARTTMLPSSSEANGNMCG